MDEAADGRITQDIQRGEEAALALSLLGYAHRLHKQHRFRASEAFYRCSLALNPTLIEAQIGLGATLHKLGDFPQARAVYTQAQQQAPGNPLLLTNLGVLCKDMGELDEAVRLQQMAVRLCPENFSFRNNLGAALLRLGREDEACACFREILVRQPGHVGACSNIARLMERTGDLAAAEEYYRQSLHSDPGSQTLRYQLGMLHLKQGRLDLGWQGYEYRWSSKYLRNEYRHFAQPQWRGEPLDGAPVLIHTEQGYGDAIQFLRYAPMVAARGGRVILQVPSRLCRLAASLSGIERIISLSDSLPEFRWQCPVMSLPYAFATTLETIPSATPYLRADAAMTQLWSQRLADGSLADGNLAGGGSGGSASGTPLRVGLIWGGNPKNGREKERSIPLELLAPLAEIPETRFYSLQMGEIAAQVQQFPAIVDLSGQQEDFAETAAIIANLDLVISIDSSVAHLTGALGKPVWIPLHYDRDWRWMMERTTTPWYPTARLFSMERGETWPIVLARLRRELEELAANRAARP
jgi:Flp pilus assembly protein TadD